MDDVARQFRIPAKTPDLKFHSQDSIFFATCEFFLFPFPFYQTLPRSLFLSLSPSAHSPHNAQNQSISLYSTLLCLNPREVNSHPLRRSLNSISAASRPILTGFHRFFAGFAMKGGKSKAKSDNK